MTSSPAPVSRYHRPLYGSPTDVMNGLRDLALVVLGMALGALVFRIPPWDVLSFAVGAGTVVILRLGWRWLSNERQARRSRGRTTPSGPHP